MSNQAHDTGWDWVGMLFILTSTIVLSAVFAKRRDVFHMIMAPLFFYVICASMAVLYRGVKFFDTIGSEKTVYDQIRESVSDPESSLEQANEEQTGGTAGTASPQETFTTSNDESPSEPAQDDEPKKKPNLALSYVTSLISESLEGVIDWQLPSAAQYVSFQRPWPTWTMRILSLVALVVVFVSFVVRTKRMKWSSATLTMLASSFITWVTLRGVLWFFYTAFIIAEFGMTYLGFRASAGANPDTSLLMSFIDAYKANREASASTFNAENWPFLWPVFNIFMHGNASALFIEAATIVAVLTGGFDLAKVAVLKHKKGKRLMLGKPVYGQLIGATILAIIIIFCMALTIVSFIWGGRAVLRWVGLKLGWVDESESRWWKFKCIGTRMWHFMFYGHAPELECPLPNLDLDMPATPQAEQTGGKTSEDMTAFWDWMSQRSNDKIIMVPWIQLFKRMVTGGPSHYTLKLAAVAVICLIGVLAYNSFDMHQRDTKGLPSPDLDERKRKFDAYMTTLKWLVTVLAVILLLKWRMAQYF